MNSATSKTNSLFDEDFSELDIFRNCNPPHGSLNVDLELRKSIARAINQCNKDRSQLREEIYELTGTDFSINSLNNWTAECRSKNSDNEDLNNNKRWGIPAEMVPALCHATGDNRPLKILLRAIGLEVMSREQQVALHISKLEQEKKELDRKLKRTKDLYKKVSK